jgi:hypothetical protein
MDDGRRAPHVVAGTAIRIALVTTRIAVTEVIRRADCGSKQAQSNAESDPRPPAPAQIDDIGRGCSFNGRDSSRHS